MYTAKVRFFKQITTVPLQRILTKELFCIPQRYDFSSKSQRWLSLLQFSYCCFVYRKGTIFQANHNPARDSGTLKPVVLYTAKVRFFKQITTAQWMRQSQACCFVYRKGTIFQANHNVGTEVSVTCYVVLYTAKVRFFKQITTACSWSWWCIELFCIPQRYDFSSKSQRGKDDNVGVVRCFVYRKGTIFQANHNTLVPDVSSPPVVLYTAKVRFFKQITTGLTILDNKTWLFCIPQRYDFSSKSQQ